jgi:hypothetical protein
MANGEWNPTRPSAYAKVSRNFATLPETGEGFRRHFVNGCGSG